MQTNQVSRKLAVSIGWIDASLRLYFVELQYEPQDGIYKKIVNHETLFQMVARSTKSKIRYKSYDCLKLEKKSSKKEYNSNIKFKSIFKVNVDKTGKKFVVKSCRALVFF